MSIRLRLTLWYVAGLSLGLIVFAAALLWQIEQATSASLDDALRQRARDVAGDLRLGVPISLQPATSGELGRELGEAAISVRVFDARGRLALTRGPSVPAQVAPPHASRGPEILQQRVGDHTVRSLVVPVAREGRRATVQVITTTHQLEETRGNLLTAMAMAGALIVCVAALGGLLLAGRALRPIDRITTLAGQIGVGDLHRRVTTEVWGSGAGHPPRDELGRLARTFDAMLTRLQEAIERRGRLSADVAHELGTPLAAIAGGAEIALRHPRDPEGYRTVLRHILGETQHLTHMVDDLLLLTHAEAGHLPLQRELVEMDLVCRQGAQALAPLADARGIALRAELPPQATVVMGDEIRLGQVVRNLLHNAIRYTPAGGEVLLRLEAEPQRGAAEPWVTVRVRDSGPGIPPDEHDRVFERFHRAGTAAPPAPADAGDQGRGAGLGLAICKAIVTAHGGDIAVVRDGQPRPDRARERLHGAHLLVKLPGVSWARGNGSG